MMTPSVCVLTVTYADRAALVERVVAGARAQGVERVIIVDNASIQPSANRLRTLAESSSGAVHLIRLEENAGSAGGYATGLSHFLEHESNRHIWLLDDDNVPSAGALDALSAELSDDLDAEQALMCVREDRRYLWDVAHGRPAAEAYPPRSSFLGFRVRDIPRKIFRSSDTWQAKERVRSCVEIPFGPYGGLLLSRSMLRKIGLPDREFYLYADDNEFTERIGRSGAKLLLVPTSTVKDIDESWNAASREGDSFGRLLDHADPRKLRFAIRNQVIFERRHWTDSALMYAINRTIYMWLLASKASSPSRRRNLEVIRAAINEANDTLRASQ